MNFFICGYYNQKQCRNVKINAFYLFIIGLFFMNQYSDSTHYLLYYSCKEVLFMF